MAGKTVVLFGAGATRACQTRSQIGSDRFGPLTNEILPRAFELPEPLREREEFVSSVGRFLEDNFHLSSDVSARAIDDYPPLPMLLSLLDAAIDRNEGFPDSVPPRHRYGPWNAARLKLVRRAVEYAAFAVLENELKTLCTNPYRYLMEQLIREPYPLSFLSLNYDIIADNTLMSVINTFPDYGCDIATPHYISPPPSFRPERTPLLKLHGSLNWLYCPACHRMDIGVTRSGMHIVKVLKDMYFQNDDLDLDGRYSCRGSPCSGCGEPVHPVMITPTHHKVFDNPHLKGIWTKAADELRTAERVVFVGYSLPPEDIEVIYLIKRNLAHLDPSQITVVEADDQHRPLHVNEVGRRYRALFGDRIDWYTGGFDRYARGLPARDPAALPTATSPAAAQTKSQPPPRAQRRWLFGRLSS